MMKYVLQKRKTILFLSALLLAIFIGFWFAVPHPLISSPYSTIIETENGELLGARIADDGQWRFPEQDSLPSKFETCLLNFEDQYFYSHPGINPVSLARAFKQNIRAKKIVSGGSTITMQLCRIARSGKARSYYNKLIEAIWALNLELRFSKKEILLKYCANAPFGGNVVGLEAASWRYFKRSPFDLSWSETATLAVLPNAPSLIYPGRRDSLLLQKRNRLLHKLLEEKEIDSLTYKLSLLEPIPSKVYDLPSTAYHLVEQVAKKHKGERVKVTIEKQIQTETAKIVERFHSNLKSNHINNAAALVLEVRKGNVLAYVGNVSDLSDEENGNHVDIVHAPRSTGSILKPFLYAALMESGDLSPGMLVPDIPSRHGGFTPLNFDHGYDGAARADEALARSLNIPAVRMLKKYGVEAFYDFLKKSGMTSLAYPAGHYGLSLILGGAECTLWDLSGMYASMARILLQYEEQDGFYSFQQFSPPTWKVRDTPPRAKENLYPSLRAASVYLTLNALLNVKRPANEAGWESFASARKIAWKTGTSFGFRDAWAVGVTKDYVVAVWAGNADGEGRSGLTGSSVAAPIMFDIFGILPQSEWFVYPVEEMQSVTVCAQSGYRPSMFCEKVDTIHLPFGTKIKTCPWHQRIHLDKSKQFRVTGACMNPSEMVHQSWFVLPPVMEYYYKQKHPLYNPLPPFKEGCSAESAPMEWIYPREMDHVFIPTQLDGTPGKVLFELAHQQNDVVVYWYLDENYVGETKNVHKMPLDPEVGKHKLYLVDKEGNQLVKFFTVVGNQ